MGTKLDLTMTGSGSVGELGPGWSVTEAASPHNPATPPAGPGEVGLSAVRDRTSRFIVGNTGVITHSKLGSITGNIGDPELTGNSVNFGIQPLLSLLAVERNMPPTGAQPLSEIFAAYVAKVTPLVEVQYDASTDPVRVFGGWSGDVLSRLYELCAVYRLEMVSTGTVLVVRDIASLDFNGIIDYQSVSISESTLAAARKLPAICYNTKLVPSLPGVKYNYSPNPSLEVNTTGWTGGWSPVGMNPTFTRVAANPLSGVYSYRMAAPVASSGAGQFNEVRHSISTSTIPDNEQVALSISVYHSFVSSAPNIYNARLELWYRWVGGAAGPVGTEVQFGVLSGFGGVRQAPGRVNFSVPSMTKPAGALFLIIYVRQVSAAASGPIREARILVGDTIWVDGVLLTNGSLIPYADGSTPGWAWSGAAGSSTSQTTLPVENDFYNALDDDNTVYTVAVGEVKKFTIDTDNYPTFLAQPTQSTGPAIQVGQYFVSSATKLQVTVGEWQAYGGKVEVAIGEEPGTIELTLTGPRTEIPISPGPYSLAAYDGDKEFATLSIAGIGVVTSSKEFIFYTGADHEKVTNELAPVLDTPFITDLPSLYSAAAWAIVEAAGPTVTLTANVKTADILRFGDLMGRTFVYDGCRYRIVGAVIGSVSTSITATWFTTAGDADAVWGSSTVAQHALVWGNYSAGDVQLAPLAKEI